MTERNSKALKERIVTVIVENASKHPMMEIASLREEQGKGEETLQLIKKELGKTHEKAVDLIWEKYLVGKHEIMEARRQHGLTLLPKKVVMGLHSFLLMRNAAIQAEGYIEENNVDSKRARSNRFLGEVQMIQRNYKGATKHFEEGVELFKQKDEWGDRVNALELSGFLAESVILSGKLEKGIEIGSKTFDDYDTGDGETLKNNDYYTWAVWKSGCAIKIWNAILYKGNKLTGDQKDMLMEILNEAEAILVIPEGDETWGDRNFKIRKDEIKLIRSKI